MKEIKD
jgi:hypothetical protein